MMMHQTDKKYEEWKEVCYANEVQRVEKKALWP